MKGGSLGKVLASEGETKLNNHQKQSIVLGVVSAMNYLHSNNVTHRDLKPDNIFLDESNTIAKVSNLIHHISYIFS